MDSEHLEAYLAGELDERARGQVEHALRNDADLRESFRAQAQLDAALRIVLGSEKEEFQTGVIARLRSEGAGEPRGFAKSVLTEIVEEREGIIPLRWPDLVKAGIVSAAASIALMFVLQGIIFREGGPVLSSREKNPSGPSYFARVEQSEGLVWADESAGRIRGDGWLPPGPLEIAEGGAKIGFNSGATVMVEGPASLSIESANRLFLRQGGLVAEVPPAASGFTVNTPRLNAVDIGTRFGVRVEPDGDSELHVMEGLVEASRASGNSVAVLVREGLALRADSRTRSELAPVPYGGDGFVLQIGSPETPVPALRYTFDESVGAVVEDTGVDRVYDIPLVASGELGNSPRRAAGKSGGGLVLPPGTSLETTLSRDFRVDDAFTFAFWVKIVPRPGEDQNRVIASYGRSGAGWDFLCNLSGDRGARGAVRVEHGDGYIVGSTDIADGNWHHVAGRFLGGDDAAVPSHFHLFVDGRQETPSDFATTSVASVRAGSMTLGKAADGGVEGWVDGVHLFREAVATSAIQSLAEQ